MWWGRSERTLSVQKAAQEAEVWGDSRMAPCTDHGCLLMAPGTSGSRASCTSLSYCQRFLHQTCYCCTCSSSSQHCCPVCWLHLCLPSHCQQCQQPNLAAPTCEKTDRQTEQQQEPITLNRFIS